MFMHLEINITGFCFLIGILGLVIGSFINVVIHRLPIMLTQQWQQESANYLNIKLADPQPTTTLNLFLPRSHCPNCHETIKFYDNIPILSYFILAGRCRYCQKTISRLYPLVELLCCLLAVAVAIRFGITWQTFFAVILTWSLICLAFIDLKNFILPDSITLPILWLGLFANLYAVFTDINSAILGAFIGYLLLWSVFHIFFFLRQKEGLGYGDFKLFALLGAWLGWQLLPLILLLASFIGAIIYLPLIALKKHRVAAPIPFGPHIALAGYIALIYGNTIVNWYLNSLS
ncbi:MAG: A24 family peptidase [Pseudomonadota bacterium]